MKPFVGDGLTQLPERTFLLMKNCYEYFFCLYPQEGSMKFVRPLMMAGVFFVLAWAILNACAAPGGSQPPQAPPPSPAPAGRTKVPAPIDSVEIAIAKSLPPQYSLQITSGLPSGCAAFDSLETKRDGTTITVTILNTIPSDSKVVCTMIYGTKQHTVELGSNFTAGTTYTVKVNEVTKTFVAQGSTQTSTNRVPSLVIL